MNAYDACRHLVETWPWRWIGSEGERAAGDWIEACFRGLGCDARRLWFDCPAWDYRGTELTLDGEPLEAGAQMFSPACEVEAETVLIQPDGKGAFAGEVRGKIAVVREGETGGVLNRGRLAHALKAAGARAALVVSVLPDTWSTKIFRDPDAYLPVAAVSARNGETLLDRIGATARLRIDASPRPGRTSDVIAQNVPPGEPVVIVCAHMDAAPYSPGASDNAAGVGVVMELAERFTRTEAASGLRFSIFGGHEFGGNDACGFGSKSYVRDYPQELEAVRLVLNFDGVGTCGDSHPQLDVWGGDILFETVKTFRADLPNVGVGHFPDGDGGADVGAFRQAGIECVWMRSVAREHRRDATYHSPLDDLRGVDESALGQCVEVAYDFLRFVNKVR
jgi:Iap family predicted aminopeptidase